MEYKCFVESHKQKKIKGEKYVDMDIYVEGGVHTVPCTQSC